MACLAFLSSILCIQFMLLYFSTSYASPFCHPHESSTLLSFKSSFTIDSYASFLCYETSAKTRTWKNGTDCCSWDGITCDTMSGHVIDLDLSCSRLQGKFHPNSTLSFLTHLRKLNLAFNHFNDSLIPSGISRLGGLTHLDLSHSEFVGELPSEISLLSKLVSLDLSGNDGIEVEASTWKRLMQNMTDLKELILGDVNLSSITPTSLSLLVNLSSSLVTLRLPRAELGGNFASEILCLPKLQELDLSGNFDLPGQLPKSNCSSYLKVLYLIYCRLEGSMAILSNFTQLTVLSLQHNNFNGQIPSSLSSLQHLISLDLSRNNFSGQIPDKFSHLSKLQYLRLQENSLGGQLPSSLFHLPQLKHLDCSINKLEGPLPDNITRHPNLLFLYLNDNRFTGTIPSRISLPSLQGLDLENNQFTGIGAFLDLVSLSYLSLSSNNIGGSVKFHHFSKLQNLEVLDISNNNFLSINLNANVNYSFPQLVELSMSSCNITTLPKFFGQLPRLQYLDLSNTNLHGEVPKWLLELGNDSLTSLNLSQNLLTSVERFSFSSVTMLDLSFNLLSGEILSLICKASNLTILNLSYNNLTGNIPQCLGTTSDLQVLDLRTNKLSGTLPNHLSRLDALEVLNLNGNKFQGPLLPSLAHCQALRVLDLGNNMMNGTFPHWLESLPQLTVLILRANKFHGVINNFHIGHPSFPMLTIFDISDNNFSGRLPKKYIENFDAMRNATKETDAGYIEHPTRYHSYFVSVEVMMKGTDVLMKKVLNALATIDLSQNMFEGEIPKAIGELHGLIALNLSHNRLTGPIPKSIGRMSDLESLDLSSNKLTGGIPTELTNLNFLSHLNLSQNKLVGMIPKGKQFNTFENDSYAGNMGLCGFPLTKKCNYPQEQPPPSQTSHHGQLLGFSWQPVVVGYGCGMVFGVMLGWCVFKTGKPEWIVRIVEGEPNQRVRRTRRRTTQ